MLPMCGAYRMHGTDWRNTIGAWRRPTAQVPDTVTTQPHCGGHCTIYKGNTWPCIPCHQLHSTAKIDPINVRLHKLARKKLYKMKSSYYPCQEQVNDCLLKLENFGNYVNPSPPIKAKQRSIFKQIDKKICLNDRSSLYNHPSNWDDFIIPDPIYTKYNK